MSLLGTDFGAYGLSVLVFPMLQQWMRKDAVKYESNLKGAIGLFTEVVKLYLIQTKGIVNFFLFFYNLMQNFERNFVTPWESKQPSVQKDTIRFDFPDNPWINRILFDVLTLLIECITCAANRIARLGYACLRYLTTSSIHSLTTQRWAIIVRSLWNAT